MWWLQDVKMTQQGLILEGLTSVYSAGQTRIQEMCSIASNLIMLMLNRFLRTCILEAVHACSLFVNTMISVGFLYYNRCLKSRLHNSWHIIFELQGWGHHQGFRVPSRVSGSSPGEEAEPGPGYRTDQGQAQGSGDRLNSFSAKD